jgi:hypothetical protein
MEKKLRDLLKSKFLEKSDAEGEGIILIPK